MEASAVAALAATLNAMAPASRQAALASMAPDVRAQLLAAGATDDAASSSAAVREARLAELACLEAERTTALWADAIECSKALEAAIMHKGFATCGGELVHWRAAFRGTLMALKRMDQAADALASDGMPTVKADKAVVRERRRKLRESIDTDMTRVEALLKACDELAALFRTLGLFQGGGEPLRAAPSSS
jgi:hypothetical protein